VPLQNLVFALGAADTDAVDPPDTSNEKRLDDPARRLDEPALVRKGFRGESSSHPFRGIGARNRSEIGGRYPADRVARIRIDDELSRRLHGPEHALGVFKRAQFVEFPQGKDKAR